MDAWLNNYGLAFFFRGGEDDNTERCNKKRRGTIRKNTDIEKLESNHISS